MKIKTPAQVYDDEHKTSPQIIKHMQALTDDVRTILKGGLSFGDTQLPFQVQTIQITSGKPTQLAMPGPFNIVGCTPIQTGGAVISSFQSKLSNGIFTVTLVMDVTLANISFLLVGVNS